MRSEEKCTPPIARFGVQRAEEEKSNAAMRSSPVDPSLSASSVDRPYAVTEEPVLLVRKARPLVDGRHCVLLVSVEPDVLGHVREVAGLGLLYRLAERLVAHSVELDTLRAVLQCRGRWRVEQRRNVVNRSVWRITLLQEVGGRNLGGWVQGSVVGRLQTVVRRSARGSWVGTLLS